MTRLRDVLDIRNIATWPVFLVYVAFNIVANWAVPLAVTAPFGLRLLAPLAAAVGAWCPILLALIIRGDGRPSPLQPFVFLSAILTAGTVRGLLLSWAFAGLGWDDSPRYSFRIIAGLVIALTLLIPLAFIVQGSRAHSRQMQRLEQVLMQLTQARQQVDLMVTERHVEAIESIRQQILAEVGHLEPHAPEESLAALQRTAAEIVRPLSHELASQVPAWVPGTSHDARPARLKWRTILSSRVSPRPLLPLASGAALGILGINPALTLLTGWGRWAFAPIMFAVTWAALRLANEAIARASTQRSVPRPAVVVFALLSAGLVGSGLLLATLPLISEPLGRTVALSCIFFIPALGAAGGLLAAVRAEQRAAEVRLEDAAEELRWQIARIGQVQWCQQRALSRALHGRVQSAVTAAAIRLDDALRSGTDTLTIVRDAQRDIFHAVDLIGLPEDAAQGSDFPSGSSGVLEVTLRRVKEVWTSIAHIDVHVEAEVTDLLADDPIAEVCVAELVGEMTSNAIRHGGAGEVLISLSADASTVTLVIENNGALPASPGSGLGSRLLDEMSLSVDTQRTKTGVTRVSAVVPVERQSVPV